MIHPTRLQLAALVSLLLHAAAVALLLPRAGGGGASKPVIVEIELLEQPEQVKGAPQETAASSDPAPPPGDEPAPAEPPHPAATPSPPIRLGNADRDETSVRVTGENVVPPQGDRRNKPPAYPAAAARRGAEGDVALLIHVTATGQTAWVDVMHSSGDPALDDAARTAAERWRFQPARNETGPVPFDVPMNIRFRLGD